MSTDHIEHLRTEAKEVGVTLNRPEAGQLIAKRGLFAAIEHVRAAGALMALASAEFGYDLDQADAMRRMDRHRGDYDRAVRTLGRQLNRRWERALNVLEAEHFAREARQRQAVTGAVGQGASLGHEASVLLGAAMNSGLAKADRYRRELEAAVAEEMGRRYPVRTDRRGLRGAIADEEDSLRADVAAELATLEARIDRLSSMRLKRQVSRVICRMRGDLADRLRERDPDLTGAWREDPERYRNEVLAFIDLEVRRSA